MKNFLMRYWWLGWGIIGLAFLILISAAISGYIHDNSEPKTKEGVIISQGKDKDNSTKAFNEAELAAANLALEKGIRIEDPQNDWFRFPEGTVQPDGRPDNSNPYPLGWTDFRSVSVGADEKYIYFKYQFWDKFPEKAFVYNNDFIVSTGAKITSFTFINKEGKEDSADLGAGPWYAENDRVTPAKEPNVGHNAMISPLGVDETMETVFKINTGEGMVAGGPGFDYILDAYPLSLFNLKLGDEVTFDSSTETGSVLFHHEALDNLLDVPGSKFGQKVRYKLGSDKYEILPNPDYKNHS